MTSVVLAASWALTAFAALVVVLNYVWAITSVQNRRRGIKRHVSTVPILVLLFCGIASLLSKNRALPYPPPLLFAALILLDPGLWVLVAVPFAMIRRRLGTLSPRTAGLQCRTDRFSHSKCAQTLRWLGQANHSAKHIRPKQTA